MRAVLSLAATAILMAPAARAEEGGTAALQRCVAAAAAEADFTGAILVSHHGSPVATVYRGRMAGPRSQPIGRETRFNVASASKMFTAVAIGQLIDRGKLRLDEPVGQVVQGLTPEAGRVTIGQLLNHTSGLGDFFRPENMETMLRARTASDILPLIADERPAFTPGSRFSYSNSGFALLGIVIERASGIPYGAYLRRNVFAPAGMRNTGLDPLPLNTLAVGMTRGGMGLGGPPGASPGQPPHAGQGAPPAGPAGGGLVLIGPDGKRIDPATVKGGGPLRPAPGARDGYGSPAGGLYSTVGDLDRFATALETGKLLSPQTLKTFTSAQVEVAPASPQGPARAHGFGFGLVEASGVQWVGHNGGTLGANAEVWFDLQDQWTVALLSNRDPPTATQLMRRIRPLVTEPRGSATCG